VSQLEVGMTKKGSKKSKLIWTMIVLAFALAIFLYFKPTGITGPQNNSSPSTPEVKGTSTQISTVQTSPIPTPFVSKGDYFELYFTNPNDPNDNSVELALIKKIDESTVSIDMAVFEFDIKEVMEALIRAEKRGVNIRIVYDSEYTDPDPEMGELKSAGILTVPDNRSALMHNKFFVFDGSCIWTGSFNITNNASHNNNENAIWFCSPEAVANYSTEFTEMYIGKFGTTSPSDTPYPKFVINGITIENCFAPEDECMAKVIKAVETADTSIHFMALSFTYDELANAMIAKADRGVIVEGIFETRSANTESSECGKLLKMGYDIRLDGNTYTFHHKVIIVDSEFVIFGSFNLTASADKDNDENLLIWYDPILAQAFEQQYQLMKSQAVVPSGTVCSK